MRKVLLTGSELVQVKLDEERSSDAEVFGKPDKSSLSGLVWPENRTG